MREGVDLSDLEAYLTRMIDCPKKIKKIKRMQAQKAGNELKRLVKQKARLAVKQKSGKYMRSIKRGKIVFNRDDDVSVRVYSNAPHSHLLEEGHAKVLWGRRVGGQVPGFAIFAKANNDFQGDFVRIAQKIADEIEDTLSGR